MKFNLVVRAMMIAAVAAVALSSAVEAQAGLFNRGNDCCEPVDCCDEGGFLSRLFDRGDDCCDPCCEPEPCCAPEPVCCEPEPCCEAPVVEEPCCEAPVVVEESCGCEAEPVCCEPEPVCCEPEPCCEADPCCEEEKGCFLQRLRDRRSKSDCCEPSCGC